MRPLSLTWHLARQLLLLLGIEFNLERRHESHFLIRCACAWRDCLTVLRAAETLPARLPVCHPHMDAALPLFTLASPCNLHYKSAADILWNTIKPGNEYVFGLTMDGRGQPQSPNDIIL